MWTRIQTRLWWSSHLRITTSNTSSSHKRDTTPSCFHGSLDTCRRLPQKLLSTNSDACPAGLLDPAQHPIYHNGASQVVQRDRTVAIIMNAPAPTTVTRVWFLQLLPFLRKNYQSQCRCHWLRPGLKHSSQPQACAPESHRRQPRDQSSISCEDQTSTISQVTANFLFKKSVSRSPKPRTNSRQSSVFLRHKQQARTAHSRQLLVSPNLPYSANPTLSFCAAPVASWDHQLLHRQEHCPVNLNFSLWETIQQTDTKKKLE